MLATGFPGMLDSMAVDEQGNLYVATLAANGLGPVNSGMPMVFARPARSGIHARRCRPAGPAAVEYLLFGCGGPDLQTAYITMGGTGALSHAGWRSRHHLAFN